MEDPFPSHQKPNRMGILLEGPIIGGPEKICGISIVKSEQKYTHTHIYI
jgi:hypothetical protein